RFDVVAARDLVDEGVSRQHKHDARPAVLGIVEKQWLTGFCTGPAGQEVPRKGKNPMKIISPCPVAQHCVRERRQTHLRKIFENVLDHSFLPHRLRWWAEHAEPPERDKRTQHQTDGQRHKYRAPAPNRAIFGTRHPDAKTKHAVGRDRNDDDGAIKNKWQSWADLAVEIDALPDHWKAPQDPH